MKKVKIVSVLKETSRVTSFGRIEFDAEGLSKEEIDYDIATAITRASNTLQIEGEEKVIKPAEDEKPSLDKLDYSKEEVDQMLVNQGNKLVSEISKKLGLSEELVTSSMLQEVEPKENVLVPKETYDRLVSDLASKSEMNLVPKTIVEEVGGLDEIDQSEGEQSSEDEFLEVKEERRKELLSLKIDDLREIIAETSIPEDEWKSLKGQEGKEKLVELIISTI